MWWARAWPASPRRSPASGPGSASRCMKRRGRPAGVAARSTTGTLDRLIDNGNHLIVGANQSVFEYLGRYRRARFAVPPGPAAVRFPRRGERGDVDPPAKGRVSAVLAAGKTGARAGRRRWRPDRCGPAGVCRPGCDGCRLCRYGGAAVRPLLAAPCPGGPQHRRHRRLGPAAVADGPQDLRQGSRGEPAVPGRQRTVRGAGRPGPSPISAAAGRRPYSTNGCAVFGFRTPG